MTRTTLLVALCGATTVQATVAHATLEPTYGKADATYLEAARLQVANEVLGPPESWEDVEGMRLEYEAALAIHGREGRGGSIEDDDSVHYARGTTLVCHIFVDHQSGTWSATEEAIAVGKAEFAKDWYRNNSPANAYMRFDNENNPGGYWAYTPFVNADLSDDDNLTDAVIEQIMNACGFVDADGDGSAQDDITLWLQDWNGGWDNVIVVIEPADAEGRARASFAYGRCNQWTDDSGAVWAHEWGHLFGACDEYADDGECNGGIDCGPCQSWYLTETIDNGNCELGSCGSTVSCLMKYNSTSNLCGFTPSHWAWDDDNDDGLLDATQATDDGFSWHPIFDLFHNGWFIHTDTSWKWVANQRWTSWSVIGVRERDGADFDLRVYGENNLNHELAYSALGGTTVDFVVGDFNHNRLGQDHVEVIRWEGDGQYTLGYESGTGMLFADGVDRAQSWNDYNVVRAFDVPLFGGETVTFDLDVDTAGLDLGMALFRSNGDTFYAARGSAEWIRDSSGGGGGETYTYTVPTDDVYGLVVWANSEVDGDWEIQIGPTPHQLSEETPFVSAWDLRLFSYQPDVNYWAASATRPAVGTNVTLHLFADASYQTELQTSGAYPSVEFIAADYNPGFSTDYLRVVRTSGGGTHRTEWEQSPDILHGMESLSWDPGHVVKVWDTYLEAGQLYQFRQYNNGSAVDGGIFLMSSADGDRYKQRSAYDEASNFRPPGEDGEWFTYTPSQNDWYGFVMITNDETSGAVGLAAGPRHTLVEGVTLTHDHPVLWARVNGGDPYWRVVAARAPEGDTASGAMWSCDSFGVECWIQSESAGAGVRYMLVDGNHTTTDPLYVRYQSASGGTMALGTEGGNETIVYTGDDEIVSGTWTQDEVARVWDLYATGTRATDDPIQIEVIPLDPDLDLAVAFHSSGAGPGVFQVSGDALVAADDGGPGDAEVIEVEIDVPDFHGLVVTSPNGASGGFEIRLRDPRILDVADGAPAATFGLQRLSPNPSRGPAVFDLALTTAGHADLRVYDVSGRLVKTLVSETLDPGSHRVSWDGRDAHGRTLAAGLYLARLVAEGRERTVKLLYAD
jgi:hypothetical protein